MVDVEPVLRADQILFLAALVAQPQQAKRVGNGLPPPSVVGRGRPDAAQRHRAAGLRQAVRTWVSFADGSGKSDVAGPPVGIVELAGDDRPLGIAVEKIDQHLLAGSAGGTGCRNGGRPISTTRTQNSRPLWSACRIARTGNGRNLAAALGGPGPTESAPAPGRRICRARWCGPKGVDTSEHDIFCDAIGRVRVRFPWDPGPPQGSSKIPPVFPFSQSDKPTKAGDNTCWVRVVEEWAGRHYGSQFLPRIGQEVLVDFLDGDPERPVITGRLYNADRRTTNIPFPDPGAKDTQLDKLTDLPKTAAFDLPLSGIKTASIPTTDGGGKPLPTRFHLLRFSDKRGKEQYLIRSQHRLDITAFDFAFRDDPCRPAFDGRRQADRSLPGDRRRLHRQDFPALPPACRRPGLPDRFRKPDHLDRAERGDPGQKGFEPGGRRQLEHQRRQPGDDRREQPRRHDRAERDDQHLADGGRQLDRDHPLEHRDHRADGADQLRRAAAGQPDRPRGWTRPRTRPRPIPGTP